MELEIKKLNWKPNPIGEDLRTHFQTPPEVCRYMASLIPFGVKTILEPTPGMGNLVKALDGYQVTAPDDYFLLDRKSRFDCIVMNPPFSSRSALLNHAPKRGWEGMKFGHNLLMECMQRSENIIALMPWFTISDSDIRLRYIIDFGLKSLTALPRKTFSYARIQTCIIELQKGWEGKTEFKCYDRTEKIPDPKAINQKFLFNHP